MASLALPDGLNPDEISEQIRLLREATEYVRTASQDEAVAAVGRAQMIREWARIYKAAGAVALEAARLQTTALRRLAQLRPDQVQKGLVRTTAVWLASLSDDDFNELLGSMTESFGPVALYRQHLQDERVYAAGRRAERLASGTETPPERSMWERQEVGRAAEEVLGAAFSDDPSTVAELADRLAQRLDMDLHEDDGPEYVAMREGLEEVIRAAIRRENVFPGFSALDGSPITGRSHPWYVTWCDPDGRWLRMPWIVAHLSHLRWWADYKQQQARDMQEAADELGRLADRLEATALAHPEAGTRVNDLWRLAAWAGQEPS